MSNTTEFEKIVETTLAFPPSFYEGYLYRFTNVANGMIYIGAHKGSVDDNYQHSSTNPILNQAFGDSTSQFKYEVLSYGTWDDMRTEEYNTLKAVDARNNNDYYNLTNGSPAYSTPDLSKCKSLITAIRNGVYAITKEHIDAHRDMKYVQSRWMTKIGSLVREIVQKLDDAKGSTAKCNPVLVFEGRSQFGGDLRIDGNNTVQAIDDCKHATEVPAMRIPYDVIESFTDLECLAMGDLMNAKSDIVKKEIDMDDAVKFLEENYNNNVPLDSDSNRSWLKEFGFTKQSIKTIIKRAKSLIKKAELKMSNKNWIDYTVGDFNQMMKLRVQRYNERKGLTSFYSSSANIKIDMLLLRLHQAFIEDGVKKAMIVLHHPSPDAKEEWDEVVEPLWFGPEGIFSTVLDEKFTVEFKEMKTTISTAPKTPATP